MSEEVAPVGGGSLLATAAAEPLSGEVAPIAETTPAEPKVEPAPEGEKPAAEPAALTAESYTDFSLPENFKFDDAKLGQFKEIAAKLGASQESAQELVTLAAEQLKEQTSTLAEAYAKAQNEGWNKTNETWKAEIAADKEIGGDNSPKVQTAIARALDEYDPGGDARKAFDLTGAGNNPALVKFIYRMASALQEGNLVAPSGSTVGKAQTLGQLFYPESSTTQ